MTGDLDQILKLLKEPKYSWQLGKLHDGTWGIAVMRYKKLYAFFPQPNYLDARGLAGEIMRATR